MKTLTRREEQILLAIYHLDEKAYLVNIREQLMALTGKTLDVGTINKSLKRLNMRGYLRVTVGDPTPVRGGKSIKYYMLTKTASQALQEAKTAHDRLWQDVVFPLKYI